jgi:phosphate butyryltransferase
MMNSFADIIAAVKAKGPKLMAVAGEPNVELAEAIDRARDEGIATAKVFDDAPTAVAAVRAGECDLLIKGTVDTKMFMKAVLDKDHGLRTGNLISHFLVIEAFGRLIGLTDGGINIAPTVGQKADIIRNAIPLLNALGIEFPKVAVLAAVEKVNPKMRETIEADELANMDIPGCVIQGPLAMDLAISPHAVAIKGLKGPVAGQADLLVVPDLASGNITAKTIMYFSDCKTGGVVAGTSRPVAFTSRSDTADIRFHTLVLGVMMC